MRTIVRTIGATLAIVAFVATSAGSALADSHNGASRLLSHLSYDNTDPLAFAALCAPCGMDGGTGTELFLDAIVQQDADMDGLGDETQDPDGGGLGQTWEDDWFEDHESGDQLDEDLGWWGASIRSLAAELDVSGDTAVLVNSEPQGGSQTPTSNPVLTAELT